MSSSSCWIGFLECLLIKLLLLDAKNDNLMSKHYGQLAPTPQPTPS